MTLQDYSRVEALLLPFLGQPKPPRYEFFLLLANAYHRKGEWDKALKIIEQGISIMGSTPDSSTCGGLLLEAGEQVRGVAGPGKSLELNPAQPEVQKAVDSLKIRPELPLTIFP